MRTLTEKEAEDFLEKEGFAIAKREFIKTKSELKKIKIPFPWVIKVSSEKIVHKAKIGGVILNISSQEEAEKSFEDISQIENFSGAIIQEMISGEELIIGIKKTEEFGPVIMFGKGGKNVEEEKDVSFRAVPLIKKDAENMIQEIKFWKIIEQKKLNKKLIAENILKVSNLAKKYSGITELDINPLIASSEIAKIADARIIFDN